MTSHERANLKRQKHYEHLLLSRQKKIKTLNRKLDTAYKYSAFWKYQVEQLELRLGEIEKKEVKPPKEIIPGKVGRPKGDKDKTPRKSRKVSGAVVGRPVKEKVKAVVAEVVHVSYNKPADVKAWAEPKKQKFNSRSTPYRPDPDAPKIVRPAAEYSNNSYDQLMSKYLSE